MMKLHAVTRPIFVATALAICLAPNAARSGQSANLPCEHPADRFDLTHWKLTLPVDEDQNGRPDDVDEDELQQYTHPDFFHLDDNGYLVFTAPNKGFTTPNSSNTRSELRQMIRGGKNGIGTHDPRNNFVLEAHEQADTFGAIGGRLQATLKVEHVPINARKPSDYSAYAAVIGQIHSGKDSELLAQGEGFGWGNEPVKIFYKKWPDHETGSVFWTYEPNLAKENPDRRDRAYLVWGKLWNDEADPKEAGLPLGTPFSYEINVHRNTAYLKFSADGRDTIQYQIDLSNNTDAHGKPDPKDHPKAYTGDWHYFKAGLYNQCTAGPGSRSPDCPGTGEWATDHANGDYARVTFIKLKLSESIPE